MIDNYLFKVFREGVAGKLKCFDKNGREYSSDKSHELLQIKTLSSGSFWKASIEPTERCNFKCIHCYVGNDRYKKVNELNLIDIEKIMDQLLIKNCIYLTLTGGEFFARADAYDIAKLACDKKFAVIIQTNASLIRNSTAEKLSKLPIYCIEVSVYGLSPEIHDTVTQVKGSYLKTIHGIKCLKKYNILNFI